jgi:N-acetylglutamate synthase-like GNAT family acetyltransferase
MSNRYREPAIDDSYHVSVHLTKWFQRRGFKKKTANQKQELPVVAMFQFIWLRGFRGED